MILPRSLSNFQALLNWGRYTGLGASRYFNKLRSRFSDYSINVAAHSMGNVVMAEALKQQRKGGFQAINNYVLMQGAVPAHCYDAAAPNLDMLTNKEDNGHRTPDTYRTYPGAINAAIRGRMVNFYNPDDFALATGDYKLFFVTLHTNWQQNQLDYKPDTGLGYRSNGVQGFWDQFEDGEITETLEITDPWELMSFVARPRSRAVGAEKAVGGVITGTRLSLKDAPYSFGDSRSDHSGQFTKGIQQSQGFYSTLLEKFGIQP